MKETEGVGLLNLIATVTRMHVILVERSFRDVAYNAVPDTGL